MLIHFAIFGILNQVNLATQNKSLKSEGETRSILPRRVRHHLALPFFLALRTLSGHM